jgi:hypothetical protein
MKEFGFIALLLLLIVAGAYGQYRWETRNDAATQNLHRLVQYEIKCKKCGAEFTSSVPGDVKNCPMCPMTEEELEALIEQVRKQQEAGK